MPPSPEDPTRILILGHSFVHQLKHFVLTRSGLQFSENFNISRPVTIRWHGVGGCTIHKVKKHDMHVVSNFRPHIVLLQLETNDLTHSSPLRI